MGAREWKNDRAHWSAVKAEIREAVWQLLTAERVVRFPGANGRIPNFVGAESASAVLRGLSVWRKAQVIKVNADAPQLPVRRAALAGGKIVYMGRAQASGREVFHRARSQPPRRPCDSGGQHQGRDQVWPGGFPERDEAGGPGRLRGRGGGQRRGQAGPRGR